jgi:hypothetical protein
MWSGTRFPANETPWLLQLNHFVPKSTAFTDSFPSQQKAAGVTPRKVQAIVRNTRFKKRKGRCERELIPEGSRVKHGAPGTTHFVTLFAFAFDVVKTKLDD